MKHFKMNTVITTIVLLMAVSFAHAQPRGNRPPRVVSPEIAETRDVTFRIYAPNAEKVLLSGSDIPKLGRGGKELTKNEEGVWEVTLNTVAPGAYRYNFNVDGVSVIDPRNPITSESNSNTWSLVYVPGAEFMDTNRVPHGAVSTITYYSTSLQRHRRMHIYTPPGYESGKGEYPVFYLLHGASDSDNSWSTVGRAGLILDNLIAKNKAKPMVVVMPTGHTGPFTWGSRLPMDEFVKEFNHDIKPYVETHYRIKTDRKSRAIAGLSMGGAQTLDIAFSNLQDYGYIGVYSSGIFGITRDAPRGNSGPSWEESHKDVLSKDEFKGGLKLFWFATGKDDFLIGTSKATVEMFEKHGFDVIFKETDGGHVWKNWREYLNEFAPKLFQ